MFSDGTYDTTTEKLLDFVSRISTKDCRRAIGDVRCNNSFCPTACIWFRNIVEVVRSNNM